MPGGDPAIFPLGATQALGRDVCRWLGTAPGPSEERDFEDGEHKVRPLCNVQGRDCYVLHSLHGDEEQSVNDKLCRLLFFAAALRDHGAAMVSVVCPYLAYARKDRRTKTRDPVTTRYVAQAIEAMGVNRIVALEPHSAAAFDNAFRIPAERLHARGPLVDALLPHLGREAITVVSPDTGGAKRAAAFRGILSERSGREAASAFFEKYRSEGVVSGDTVAGSVDGRVAVIIDDLIASGTTMRRAARACRERGAVAVFALATHGVFADGAEQLLQDPAIDRLFITDSVAPRMEASWGERVERVPVAPLFGEVIRALSRGGSVADVLTG
ncbi:MAG: ribose-phosphate diphosphokinase [Halofilum sp. (in: g-proteobacteria)]